MLTYEPLEHYLGKQSADEVPMTFTELERIIGAKLPPSAHKEGNAWWSNNRNGHSQAVAWLNAGFEAGNVDRKAKKLVFRRVRQTTAPPAGGMAEEGRVFQRAEHNQPGRHPAIGALKGTFTVEPGWDLTRPALDPEELEEWEASLDRKADLIEQVMTGKKR